MEEGNQSGLETWRSVVDMATLKKSLTWEEEEEEEEEEEQEQEQAQEHQEKQ